MGTSVYYNGLELRNVITREFEQSPIRDESNTDILYTKFNIYVETVMNADLLTDAVINLGIVGEQSPISATSVGSLLANVAKILNQDRKPFRYVMDGVEVINLYPSTEANNGPKVFGVRLTQISSKTVRIRFGIECAVVQCDQALPVISNRWSMTEDIDGNFVATRRWRGKLRLKNAVFNPQAFRGLCVPVLHKGWKREGMNFVGETNSLELAYEISDRQLLGDAPPPGAVRMSGTHVESLFFQGSKGSGNISLRLDGSPGQDKRYLIERAVQIVAAKLDISSTTNDKWLKQVTITDYFGDDVNSVEVSANIERANAANGSDPAALIGAMSLKTIGLPMRALNLSDYQDGVTYVQGPYATATLAGLFACYLQTPCDQFHGMPQIGEQQPGREDTDRSDEDDDNGQSIANVAEGTVPPGFAAPVNLSEQHKEAMYTHASIDSEYLIDDNRIALPIASTSDSDETQATMAVVRLAKRTAKRKVTCEFERIGEPPQLWDLEDFEDSNGIMNYFMKCVPTFKPPTTTGDGSVLHSVDATYWFVLSRCPTKAEQFKTGSLPWDTRTSEENEYPEAAFVASDDVKGI